MRGIVVTLVFLFLTGTQARHFWQQDEPPPSPMERLREQFQLYLESAKASAREAIAQLDASPLGQQFGLDMATNVDVMAAMAEQVREQMAPSYHTIRERLRSDYQEMTADLEKIKDKIKPFCDALLRDVQEAGQAYHAKLKPVFQEWEQRARQDLEGLQSKVEPITAEARDKVRVLVADFRQKMSPYMEEVQQVVRQKLQQLQERAVPRAQEMQTVIEEQVSNMRDSLAPMMEAVRQKIGPAVKTLQERLVSWLTTVQRKLEQQQQQQQQQQQP